MTTRTLYIGLLFHDASNVLQETYPDAAARTRSMIEAMKDRFDEVELDDVRYTVLAMGVDPDPDELLEAVHALYMDHGVDMHTFEITVPSVPEDLHLVITDDPDTVAVEAYASAEKRRVALRDRLASLSPAGTITRADAAEHDYATDLVQVLGDGTELTLTRSSLHDGAPSWRPVAGEFETFVATQPENRLWVTSTDYGDGDFSMVVHATEEGTREELVERLREVFEVEADEGATIEELATRLSGLFRAESGGSLRVDVLTAWDETRTAWILEK